MLRNFPAKGNFEREVLDFSEKEFGGLVNAHIHGDRAYTRRDEYYKHVGISINDIQRLSLPEKQRLTWALHRGPAFEPDCILERGERLIKESLIFGVKKICTTVDITYNTGLKSLEIWEKLRDKYVEQIEIRLLAYNPSGFKVKGLADERFELFEEATKRCDGLVGLAEKDRKLGHIGERQHNLYIAGLSYKFHKPAQYHVGQENRPSDRTTEFLLEDLGFLQDVVLKEAPEKFPIQTAVHAISPSCQSTKELDRIIREMVKRGMSLIVCPRAAISMLQDSSVNSPIHNSIASGWRFASQGIPISLGIDNLDDIYVPASSADPYDELEYFSNSLRGYHPRTLAKILSEVKLDPFDMGRVQRELIKN